MICKNCYVKKGFVETRKGRYEVIPANESVQSLKGIIKKPKNAVSIEFMNEIITSCGKI